MRLPPCQRAAGGRFLEEETDPSAPLPFESGGSQKEKACVLLKEWLGVRTQSECAYSIFSAPKGKPDAEWGLHVDLGLRLPFYLCGQER